MQLLPGEGRGGLGVGPHRATSRKEVRPRHGGLPLEVVVVSSSGDDSRWFVLGDPVLLLLGRAVEGYGSASHPTYPVTKPRWHPWGTAQRSTL